jgi:hypothetical protein
MQDSPQCVGFGLFMIWFASITVNLGPTFLRQLGATASLKCFHSDYFLLALFSFHGLVLQKLHGFPAFVFTIIYILFCSDIFWINRTQRNFEELRFRVQEGTE